MIEFRRATAILPHHAYPQSLGAPLVRLVATIDVLFPSPGNHHGANHQHLIARDVSVELARGIDGAAVADRIFVAIRFGDMNGLMDPVPFVAGERARFQGEYIDAAAAYVTQDDPGLAVLHFTHHPAGFVEFPLDPGTGHGEIYS